MDDFEEKVENLDEISETPAHKNGWDAFWNCKWNENKLIFVVKETLEYIMIIAAAFVIAILLNIYIFRISNVVGHSMDKSYHDGQVVWLSKLPYVFGEPKRGDVIILDSTKEKRTFAVDFVDSVKSNLIVRWFVKPENLGDPDRFYIKRVIAVGGDTISFKENAVWVNGEKLDESSYVNPEMVPDYRDLEGVDFTVSEGCVFVMGDNRNRSSDSRLYGEFPTNCILGKVMVKGQVNE